MKDWTRSNLGERVRESLRLGGYVGRGGPARFAKESGLNSATLARICQDERPTAERRAGDTITKIATTAKVNPAWLTSGQGQPKDAQSAPPAVDDEHERYPTKRTAAAVLRGLVDDAAIEAMLSEEHRGSEEDPGTDFWIGRARWWNSERERIKSEIQTGGAIAKAPPLQPRPKAR